MKIVLTGGGTAGHINPALAVGGYIKKREPNTQILYIGKKGGMEERLVPEAGYDFVGLETKGFARSFTPSAIKQNIDAVRLLFKSRREVRKILADFAPDVVFGTGGYVSAPVITAAAKMGIKTVTHEQNAFPGVTTKYVAKYVDKLLLAFEDAKAHLKNPEKAVVVGNPIKEEILFADRNAVREKLNIGDKFCIVSFGGSLGATVLNNAIIDLIKWHIKDKNIHHIHAVGKRDYKMFLEKLAENKIDLKQNPQLDIREYISDMPDCYAAADLIIGRAGAITLTEIPAVGKASILIPSPNVTENHQYHNAMVLGSRGAGIVIEEKDLTSKRLIDEVNNLFTNRDKRAEIEQNAKKLAIIDACEKITKEIKSLF